MAATYTIDDGTIAAIGETIMREFYPDMLAADLTIEWLLAHGGLKLRGWPAYATVKANSLKDRVAGLADVRILIDADRWGGLSPNRQQAIIHHELHHVIIRQDDTGGVLTDDANRPKVKLRQHDFESGGFSAIAQRYGEDAPEYALWVAAGSPVDSMEDDEAGEE